MWKRWRSMSEAVRAESSADGRCHWDGMYTSVRADGSAVWMDDEAGVAWVLNPQWIDGCAARAWRL